MAETTGKIGFGTLFKRGDGATPTEAFTAVAEVLDIDGPGMSRDAVDATHQESPNGFKEAIPGLRDAGEITFPLNFLESNASQNAIRDDLMTGTARNYQVVFPGGQIWQFKGFITGFSPKAPIEDRMTADVTVKITGKPTIT